MRKLLLKLANRIYIKYGFKEIYIGQKFIFKDDIYTVEEITLNKKSPCIGTLNLKLQKRETLTDYLSEKIGNKNNC